MARVQTKNQKVKFRMQTLLDSFEFGAQADDQKKPQGQHHFKNLRKKIYPVSLKKKKPFHPDSGQTDDNTHAGQDHTNKIIPAGAGTGRQGQPQKNKAA
jgi:hypothetical protein